VIFTAAPLDNLYIENSNVSEITSIVRVWSGKHLRSHKYISTHPLACSCVRTACNVLRDEPSPIAANVICFCLRTELTKPLTVSDSGLEPEDVTVSEFEEEWRSCEIVDDSRTVQHGAYRARFRTNDAIRQGLEVGNSRSIEVVVLYFFGKNVFY
jgi:hypothetical protein